MDGSADFLAVEPNGALSALLGQLGGWTKAGKTDFTSGQTRADRRLLVSRTGPNQLVNLSVLWRFLEPPVKGGRVEKHCARPCPVCLVLC